ncbi:MAG TPA: hypothetical protein VF207_09420 [Chthoniobacterales bacterium]|jgi:hypothetical protein
MNSLSGLTKVSPTMAQIGIVRPGAKEVFKKDAPKNEMQDD